MDLTPDQAALAVERHDCPNCDAPAGSACRTRGGRTAAKYHSPLRPRPRAPRGTGDPCPRRPVPPGRARDVRHPHGTRARASGQERRRADDAVRRAPGRLASSSSSSPGRSPGSPTPTAWARCSRGRRADRAQLHPGEDPQRPGHRRVQGQPRRTAEGRRRRHAHLRGRPEGQGRPRPPTSRRSSPSRSGRARASTPRSPRSTGPWPKPMTPRWTTDCRCGPSPYGAAGPKTRSPPRRSTCAIGSNPSPTRTPRCGRACPACYRLWSGTWR